MFFIGKIHRGVLAALFAVAAGFLIWGASHTAAVAVQAQPVKGVDLPIIMYHSILPYNVSRSKYIVSPKTLENDLAYLQQEHFTTVTMQDVIAYVKDGTELPSKPILITFDDGYYNNYVYAYPLFKKYNMKMMLSPIAHFSELFSEKDGGHETYSHATWDQLSEMQQSGVVEIENHTYNLHSQKGRLGAKKLKTENTQEYQVMLRKDLQQAQNLIKEHVGVDMNVFVYPFGAVSPEALPVIRSLGFEATLTCQAKMNVLTHSENCLIGLGRFLRPPGESSAAYFRRIMK